MAHTVGDFLVERLRAWGIHRIYGYPGDGINGIIGVLGRAVGDAWDQAFAADRPFVLEAYTDPNVPSLPPHITFQQAKAFVSSMVKGDPAGVIRRSFRDLVARYVAHKRGGPAHDSRSAA